MTLFAEADWQYCTCISRPLLDDEIGLQYHNLTLTIGRVLAARGNTEVVPQGATSTRGTILRRIGASTLTVVKLVGELAHVLDVGIRRSRAQPRERCRRRTTPGRAGRRRGQDGKEGGGG